MVRTNVIRARLALLGMTQQDLADRLGISKNTLSSRMNGKSSFTLEEIEAICEILSITDPAEKRYIFLS